jgi:ABC-type branched-subunit amino acid transport system substrate-binding protein
MVKKNYAAVKIRAFMNTKHLSPKAVSILGVLLCLLGLVDVGLAAPIRVGMTLPLTGKLSSYGVAFRNGVELFREENSNAVSQVTFIFDDSQYDGTKVATAVRKLTAVDNELPQIKRH